MRTNLPSKNLLRVLLLLGAGCASVRPAGIPERTGLSADTSEFGKARASYHRRALFEVSPESARSLGFHEYDGKVGDFSEASTRAWIEELRGFDARFASMDASKLDPEQRLDLGLIRGEIALKVFWLVDMPAWRQDPRAYAALFDVSDYVERDYAPLAQRAQAVVAHERAALAQVANVRRNLQGPMSRPILEVAIRSYQGFATYLRNDVVAAVKPARDEALQRDFASANESLARALDGLVEWMRTEELPRANQSHVLGPERFAKLLRAQEGWTGSLTEFRRIGEDDLAANRAAYLALQGKVRETRPEADEELALATRIVAEARQFLTDHHIATVPSQGADAIAVKPTPPYDRWNFASLSPAPLFEQTTTQSFYYVTPPDPSWSKAEQEQYVPTRGVLIATTVHETFPGHFLHFLHIREAPTFTQKVTFSYSFGEGWAHYSEQMMADEGFHGTDTDVRLGQLRDALRRDCRYLASYGIHVAGLSVEQAAKRFEEDCFQDVASAKEQAVRGTFDPGYFAYTFGKLQIRALRDEAQAALGPRFSLERFHDALLSHGAPPVPLMRERVLTQLGVTPSPSAR